MNWRCFFGLHDWEIIRSKHERHIEQDVECDLEGRQRWTHRHYSLAGSLLKKKVCLRCEKLVDEIAEHAKLHQKKYLARKEEVKYRKDKVNEIIMRRNYI